jgi:hypothetical protein
VISVSAEIRAASITWAVANLNRAVVTAMIERGMSSSNEFERGAGPLGALLGAHMMVRRAAATSGLGGRSTGRYTATPWTSEAVIPASLQQLARALCDVNHCSKLEVQGRSIATVAVACGGKRQGRASVAGIVGVRARLSDADRDLRSAILFVLSVGTTSADNNRSRCTTHRTVRVR